MGRDTILRYTNINTHIILLTHISFDLLSNKPIFNSSLLRFVFVMLTHSGKLTSCTSACQNERISAKISGDDIWNTNL